jgi:hypothetical protein
VEAALRKKAEAGDVSAARELREWTRQQQPGVGSLNEDILSLLTDEQLEILEGWIAARQEGTEGTQPP